MFTINGIPAQQQFFAYDGCHKIYLIDDEADKQEALNCGYELYPMQELEAVYNNSCELHFISNWKLNTFYANQFENAIFDEE